MVAPAKRPETTRSPVVSHSQQYLIAPMEPQPPMQQLLSTQHSNTGQNTPARAPPDRSLQARSQASDLQTRNIDATPQLSGSGHQNCWVTVFGFPRGDDREKVMLEFRRIGEVTQELVAGENYVHIQYATEELARRALDKNHKEMMSASGSPFMIGVKPYSIQEATKDHELLIPTAQVSMGQQLRMHSELDAQRNYLVESNPDIAVQQSDSLWTRMGFFVFGA